MEILLPFLGFLIGIVASMIGIGGGVFMVPLLILLYEFSPPQAIGTSLTAIFFTSLASTANYSKQRRIYYKIGLALALATVPGAFLGAYLTSIIEPRILGLIFGGLLFFIALRMIFKFSFFKRGKTSKAKSETTFEKSESSFYKSKTKILLGVTLSFFGGLSSGLLGIGGGSVLVPIMTLTMYIPMYYTVATSMFIMIFTSTSGIVKHFSLSNINFQYALLLVLGTIFGAQLGAYASKRISSRNLRRIFGVVLVLVSIRMIMKYV